MQLSIFFLLGNYGSEQQKAFFAYICISVEIKR